jgi:hypothetical protein
VHQHVNEIKLDGMAEAALKASKASKSALKGAALSLVSACRALTGTDPPRIAAPDELAARLALSATSSAADVLTGAGAVAWAQHPDTMRQLAVVEAAHMVRIQDASAGRPSTAILHELMKTVCEAISFCCAVTSFICRLLAKIHATLDPPPPPTPHTHTHTTRPRVTLLLSSRARSPCLL